MNQEDYYQVLGVEKGTAQQTIKEAYRKLAFQYHPDRNRGNPAALEKMKRVNEAYAILSDPRKRKEYDALSREYGPSAYDRFRQSHSEEDIFRGSDINQVFEEMARAFGFRGFEEIFRESYGRRYQTFEFRRPGFFGKGFIFVSPGFRGKRNRFDRSEISSSSRTFSGLSGKLTRYLLRKMLLLKQADRGKDLQDVIILDSEQARKGGKGRYLHHRRSKELLVTIPPGIREGQKIRLKGMGAEGKDGGEPGDLYLQVRFKKPFIQRIRDLLRV